MKEDGRGSGGFGTLCLLGDTAVRKMPVPKPMLPSLTHSDLARVGPGKMQVPKLKGTTVLKARATGQLAEMALFLCQGRVSSPLRFLRESLICPRLALNLLCGQDGP